MTEEASEQVLSLDDVLRELNITRNTFYRYRRQGLIASTQHGGRTIVLRKWIDDYYARRAAVGDKARNAAEKAHRSRRRSA